MLSKSTQLFTSVSLVIQYFILGRCCFREHLNVSTGRAAVSEISAVRKWNMWSFLLMNTGIYQVIVPIRGQNM